MERYVSTIDVMDADLFTACTYSCISQWEMAIFDATLLRPLNQNLKYIAVSHARFP